MSLADRTVAPKLAEDILRECLVLDPRGGQLTVSGRCMEPVLLQGAMIQVEVPARPVRTGDVVLVQTSAGLRLHRIVLRLGQTLRTKGDRSVFLDPAVDVRDVVGVWASAESRTGSLLRVGASLGRYILGRIRRLHPGGAERPFAEP
jgi:hypothetical protein